MRNTIKNNCITQGIKISRKWMRLIDKQRKTTIMEKKDLKYIEQYRKIYRRVIQEAKRRENDNYIRSSKNKVKATWQLINKELGKSFISNKNIELKLGKSKISNPSAISELFNSYFAETIEKLTDQNSGTQSAYNTTNLKINTCPQTMYIIPVTENEIEKVVKNLEGKRSSGFDGVADSIVKKCVQFIKKPLADICNTSSASGTFPEILKLAIVKPLHKNR